MELPEDLFIQDVTERIAINQRGRGKAAHVVSGAEHLVAESRAHPQHRRYDYDSDSAEGEGWRYDVDDRGFRGILSTLIDKSTLHLYEEQFREIEQVVERASANGTVTIEWTVAILLATRK